MQYDFWIDYKGWMAKSDQKSKIRKSKSNISALSSNCEQESKGG